jgi:hypothetical protein
MEYAESILERYQKVSVLVERGVGGEKENAKRTQARMQSQYPGIHSQSSSKQRGRPEPANGNFGGRPPAPAPAPAQDNRWEKWGRMAGSAFSWAAGAAMEAASFEYARGCADHFVEVVAKNLPSGKFQVSARISAHDLYRCSDHLDDAQKHAFASKVGEEIAEQILVALYPE